MKIDKVVHYFSQNKLTYFLFKKIYNAYIKKSISDYRNKNYLKHSSEILSQATKALESEGIFFWLEFGTLLGAFRDNDFIKSDCDIDLGIFFKDYSPKIKTAMIKYGFKLVKEIRIDGNYGLEQTFSYNGVYLDLFYFSKHDKMFNKVHTYTLFKDLIIDNKEKYDFNNEDKVVIEMYMQNNGFKKLFFKNHTYNIPDKTADYLAYYYGKDFLKPRKWDYNNLISDNKNSRLIDVKNLIK